MAIGGVFGGEFFKCGLEVVNGETGLELGCGYAGGRSDDEDRSDAAGDGTVLEARRDPVGQIKDFAAAAGFDVEFVGLNGHRRSVSRDHRGAKSRGGLSLFANELRNRVASRLVRGAMRRAPGMKPDATQ